MRVWDWFDAVAAADLRPPVKIFALTAGRFGDALTGRNVKLPPDGLANLLGVNERTIRRHIEALERSGYLTQTQRPGPDTPSQYAMFGPPRFVNGGGRKRVTPDIGKRDDVHRTADTPTPDDVRRSRGATPDTFTPGDVQGSTVNGGHYNVGTPDTITPADVRNKQESNSSSSSQSTTYGFGDAEDRDPRLIGDLLDGMFGGGRQ